MWKINEKRKKGNWQDFYSRTLLERDRLQFQRNLVWKTPLEVKQRDLCRFHGFFMLWGWSQTDPMDGCAGCHSRAVAVYCHQGAMSQTTALWAAFACAAEIKSQLKPLSVLCSSVKHNSSKAKGSLQIHPHWAACLWFSGAPHTSIIAKAVILRKVTQTHICKIGFTWISTAHTLPRISERLRTGINVWKLRHFIVGLVYHSPLQLLFML